jgi:hypothetical protein
MLTAMTITFPFTVKSLSTFCVAIVALGLSPYPFSTGMPISGISVGDSLTKIESLCESAFETGETFFRFLVAKDLGSEIIICHLRDLRKPGHGEEIYMEDQKKARAIMETLSKIKFTAVKSFNGRSPPPPSFEISFSTTLPTRGGMYTRIGITANGLTCIYGDWMRIDDDSMRKIKSFFQELDSVSNSNTPSESSTEEPSPIVREWYRQPAPPPSPTTKTKTPSPTALVKPTSSTFKSGETFFRFLVAETLASEVVICRLRDMVKQRHYGEGIYIKDQKKARAIMDALSKIKFTVERSSYGGSPPPPSFEITFSTALRKSGRINTVIYITTSGLTCIYSDWLGIDDDSMRKIESFFQELDSVSNSNTPSAPSSPPSPPPKPK